MHVPSTGTANVPREATRAVAPIPPGHQDAFLSLGRALGVVPPASRTVVWLPWQVVERSHGFHVTRIRAFGEGREFLKNSVRKVTMFRSRERAEAAAATANAKVKGGAA